MSQAAGTGSSRNRAPLKVMTFNLRTYTAYDAGNEWTQRAPWAAETIAAHAPSIAGVQEAYLLMLEDLQRELPDYAWIGQGRRGGSEDEHCAIFYRKNEFEVVGQGQFWLSETPDAAASLGWDSDYPRICTWGRFRSLESGEELRVYNTHLDHIGERARIEGVKLAAAVMLKHDAEHPDSAAVLMGDMNGGPSDAPLRFLRGELAEEGPVPALQDAYDKLQGESGRTFHDFEGGLEGEPIDYIFAAAPLRVLRSGIDRRDFGGQYPSDHYPLIAELELD
ncbi:endonuclease/exonuclease/phosphatase family protein [Saccharibacillus alkalitolerans]|uniref:Endonuclease/exonuclease/phosphatase family protein n=1 Tax=Saccharibacillus alkalitolerans TaxID=2705290 RepID=A0ABX0F1F3_9BACL|nr:endonuclease/exonuclease/phosphatase family protein [Saccharibacillus alkalitolerans]NGZ74372.1 endonuclease/exonuclease/phosphatase family protein [Saccharibacillus alkalitolerans]